MKPVITLFVSILLIFSLSAQKSAVLPTIHKPVISDSSPKLLNMKSVPAQKYEMEEAPNLIEFNTGVKEPNVFSRDNDPVVQYWMGRNVFDPPAINIEGVSRRNGITPPDTHGDVGPNHYFQTVNVSFGIWDKQGNLLYGPENNWTIFSGLGIGTNFESDPVVVYDHLADRWLFAEMAFNYPNGPYYMVIAISQTPDPLGAYYRYAYYFEDMCDYPKFGVWPDGYYMTINQVTLPNLTWAGAGVVVFERDSIIAGVPDPRMVYFDLEPQGNMFTDPFSFLPADLDGTPPPAGTPSYLCYFKDDAWGLDYDHISVWECSVDWENPDNSTLGEVNKIRTEAFDSNTDNFTYITQPGLDQKLQSLSNRFMYGLKFRVFDNHFSMVTNHTVDVEDKNHAGVRWYELRNSGTEWSIYQQGTYAPDDDHRWMGSCAIDKNGNIALGYSVSSETTYPSVRVTGRRFDDPPGEMTYQELEVATGLSSQIFATGRWGDYSMMTVDPVDDLTFWYTQEYMPEGNYLDWNTKIVAFNIDADTITSVNPALTHQFNIQFNNPVSGNLTLNCIFDKAIQEVLFRLFSFEGRLLEKGVFYPGLNCLNTMHLPSGIYILRVENLDKGISRAYKVVR